MNKPVLVVLAAGMGSRYGGLKQMDSMTGYGQNIIDYSVYDARRAGFEEVIFVIKREIEADFKALVGARIGRGIRVRYAFQEMSDLPEGFSVPAGRKKPWGTTHAVLAARELIDGPFAVINADDYYGRSAFTTIYEELMRLEQTGKGTMVGYRLMNTVSDHGTVSRGVCQTENGSLKKVKETLKIKKYPDGSIADIADPENEVPLAPESPVSMNFWGFTPWIFEEMEAYFTAFLKGLAPDELKAECLLPVLVDKLITEGKLDISVLDTDAVWFGVTYKEDRPIVEAELKKLHAAGVYPASLKN